MLTNCILCDIRYIFYVKYTVFRVKYFNIDVSFYVTSIDDIDMSGESFSVSGFWAMTWTDPRLSWTPASYGNIDLLTFFPADIWSPSIFVINSQNDLSSVGDGSVPIRVSQSGDLYWQPTSILTMSCGMDTTFFPFDKQSCYIEIVTIGLTGTEMTLNSSTGVDFTFCLQNGQWTVEGSSLSITYPVLNSRVHYNIRYFIDVRRRSAVYWMKIILPISLKAYIVPMVFLLPSEDGEKMDFSLQTLLAFVLILSIIEDDMSDTALHTSVLEVEIILILCLSGISVILSSFVDMYGRRGDLAAPGFIVRAVKVMARLMCREDVGEDKVEPLPVAVFSPSPNGIKRAQQPPAYVEAGNEVVVDGGGGGDGGGSRQQMMTCLQCAEIMDAFWFRTYLIVVTVIVFGFNFILIFGAS